MWRMLGKDLLPDISTNVLSLRIWFPDRCFNVFCRSTSLALELRTNSQFILKILWYNMQVYVNYGNTYKGLI